MALPLRLVFPTMGAILDEPTQSGTAQGRRVTLDGQRELSYRTYGDPAGDAVLLFHGTPGSGSFGAIYHEIAAEEGVHLIAPDRPGYGESTAWDRWGPEHVQEAIEPVIAEEGVTSLGVVAFSGGAPFALELGAAWPDRVGSITLVSAATPPTVGEAPPLAIRLVGYLATAVPALAHAAYRFQYWLGQRRPDLLVNQLTSTDDAVPDTVSDPMADAILDGIDDQTTGAVAESRLFTEEWDVRVSAVRQSVEIFHGDDDQNAPLSGARTLSQCLPDARLQVIEDEDHLGTLSETRRRVLQTADE